MGHKGLITSCLHMTPNSRDTGLVVILPNYLGRSQYSTAQGSVLHGAHWQRFDETLQPLPLIFTINLGMVEKNEFYIQRLCS